MDSPGCRLRQKTSPKAAKRGTAVKSRAKPQASRDDSWTPDNRLQMLKLLFAWPLYVWKVFFDFKRRVQHTYANDGEYKKAAAETAAANKRRKLNGIDADASDTDDSDLGRRMLETMGEISMSSSFSGIDTPSTAFLSLGAGLCEYLGLPMEHIPRPRNAFGVEWLSASQNELLEHPHGPEHVFTDIAEFWQPTVAARLPAIMESGQTDAILAPLIRQGKAVKREAFCVRHQKLCQARFSSKAVEVVAVHPI